jgi:hypothetical protein
MIETGQNAFFLPEMANQARAAQSRLDQFDCHLAAQLRVFGQIDFPHPAFTQQGEDFVLRKNLPGLQRAVLRRQQVRAALIGGCFDKVDRFIFVIQERFHFGAQRCVAAARVLEEGREPGGLTLERTFHDFRDLLRFLGWDH